MFNRFAALGASTLGAFRRQLPAAARRPSNDNQRGASLRPHPAQPLRLGCRWRTNKRTGRPECHWQLEPADEPQRRESRENLSRVGENGIGLMRGDEDR
jgi:hypothetical protein